MLKKKVSYLWEGREIKKIEKWIYVNPLQRIHEKFLKDKLSKEAFKKLKSKEEE